MSFKSPLHIQSLFEDFFSMLYPNSCVTCDGIIHRNEGVICTICQHQLPVTNYHLMKENSLAKRFWGRISFEHAFAYLKYIKHGTVQKMIHALKYQGKEQISEYLGIWYGKQLKDDGFQKHFDLVLPIPLHVKRQKQRGYNQSDGFAKGLAMSLEIAWSNQVLKRVKASATQTRKNRYNRWLNVKDLFVVTDKDFVKGKHILLVDDVITTGATMEACAQVLLDAGCSAISLGAMASAK